MSKSILMASQQRDATPAVGFVGTLDKRTLEFLRAHLSNLKFELFTLALGIDSTDSLSVTEIRNFAHHINMIYDELERLGLMKPYEARFEFFEDQRKERLEAETCVSGGDY